VERGQEGDFNHELGLETHLSRRQAG
jgi:hypothetical protein